MDNISKIKLFIITILLDLFLLFTVIKYSVSNIDLLWISIVFLCHIAFYVALHNENRFVLDILHYFVFILPSTALFIQNIYIKTISLLLFILIQILWIKEDKCILNEDDYNFGYGNELNYYLIIYTPILALSIGYLHNSTKNLDLDSCTT
tara:strand:+ start:9751 stop:10200 length:450 start_codon:yes stop_codon:yes gene_type:complete